MYKTAVYAS